MAKQKEMSEIIHIGVECELKTSEDIVCQMEWERQDELYRITGVRVETYYERGMMDGVEFPFVKVWLFECSQEAEREYLDAGWKPGQYLYFEGVFPYWRLMDVRENIKEIVISFDKKTEQRDKDSFGFTKSIMGGRYRYRVPVDLLEPLAKYLWEEKRLEVTGELRGGAYKRVCCHYCR